MPPRTSDPQRLRAEFAAALQERLDALGLTRRQFQRALLIAGVDVTTQTISQWALGRTLPHPAYRPTVARVLRAEPGELFGEAA